MDKSARKVNSLSSKCVVARKACWILSLVYSVATSTSISRALFVVYPFIRFCRHSIKLNTCVDYRVTVWRSELSTSAKNISKARRALKGLIWISSLLTLCQSVRINTICLYMHVYLHIKVYATSFMQLVAIA